MFDYEQAIMKPSPLFYNVKGVAWMGKINLN